MRTPLLLSVKYFCVAVVAIKVIGKGVMVVLNYSYLTATNTGNLFLLDFLTDGAISFIPAMCNLRSNVERFIPSFLAPSRNEKFLYNLYSSSFETGFFCVNLCTQSVQQK